MTSSDSSRPSSPPSSSSAREAPLAGRTIALPETRELDRFAELLESEGARTWRCPLLAIVDAPDQAAVTAWVDDTVSAPFDDLVFLTGEGVRRLVSAAERAGRREALVAAFGKARRITRGPKPAKALHELGLKSDKAADPPTSEGVMAALAGEDLTGHRVGLQLYGQEPNLPLRSFLERKGAQVFPVAPYAYADASDDQKVLSLIEAMARGEVDLIGFTSAGQTDRLWELAKRHAVEAELEAGLARTKVAAVGPVAAEALASKGVRTDLVPSKPFVLKHFVATIVELLATSPRPV